LCTYITVLGSNLPLGVHSVRSDSVIVCPGLQYTPEHKLKPVIAIPDCILFSVHVRCAGTAIEKISGQ
jgi:hypothetical protein